MVVSNTLHAHPCRPSFSGKLANFYPVLLVFSGIYPFLVIMARARGLISAHIVKLEWIHRFDHACSELLSWC